jgi:hypothetical protein
LESVQVNAHAHNAPHIIIIMTTTQRRLHYASSSTASLPTIPTGVACKSYVDAVAQDAYTVKAVATAPLAGTHTYANSTITQTGTLAAFATEQSAIADTVSGITTVGDAILLTAQAAPAENGVYTLTTVGDVATAWVLTRAFYLDSVPTNTVGGLNAGDRVVCNNGTAVTGGKGMWECTYVGADFTVAQYWRRADYGRTLAYGGDATATPALTSVTTLTKIDRDVYLTDSTGGAFTLTLPDVATGDARGHIVLLVNRAASGITAVVTIGATNGGSGATQFRDATGTLYGTLTLGAGQSVQLLATPTFYQPLAPGYSLL